MTVAITVAAHGHVETIVAPTLIAACQEATRRHGPHWHFVDPYQRRPWGAR